MQHISDAELAIMEVLWSSSSALSFTQILEKAKYDKGWNESTIKTLLYRLMKKNAVSRVQNDVYLYSPLITKEEYTESTMQSFSQQLFHGSMFQVISGLLSSADMTEEEMEQLSQLIREKRGQ